MPSTLLSGRAVGKFPLSIATSLAIESALNVHDEIKHPHAPILDYNQLWVNVRTLFRNMLGAIEGEHMRLLPDECLDALDAEMQQIESIITEANPRCKVVFYLSEYAGLERKYPHATPRVDNTEKQREYTALQKQTLQGLLDHDKRAQVKRVLGFDLKLKQEHPTKTLILTHYAFDLCSYKAFAELVLLESHTGHIKEKPQWYTKYLNGKELANLPFREDLLQIFGDKESFRPGDIKLRREILDIATKYRWGPLTTLDKIRYGIDQMLNPYYKSVLKSMLVP